MTDERRERHSLFILKCRHNQTTTTGSAAANPSYNMIEHKVSAAAAAPLSSVATAMLFGTITFATVALATRTWLIGDSRAILTAMQPRAQPLDIKSFTSIYTLLHHFTVFGLILFFAYICENHPFFPHDEKAYDRDQFFFLVALLFLLSSYTVHKNEKAKSTVHRTESSSKLGDKLQALSNKSSAPNVSPTKMDETSYSSYTGTLQTTGTYIRASDTSPANDVLNRDQTEEWKGWMQFVFLFYHYYHAEEIYNSIRIMITCKFV